MNQDIRPVDDERERSKSDQQLSHPQFTGKLHTCTERLDRLAIRIDQFFQKQHAQLELMREDVSARTNDQAKWEQMVRELRMQQEHWEQMKQTQAAQIAEEVDMLTSAWDRIEAERRTLMTESPQINPPIETDAPDSSPMAHKPQVPDYLMESDSSAAGHFAALQFQQIKREIRRHARRNPS